MKMLKVITSLLACLLVALGVWGLLGDRPRSLDSMVDIGSIVLALLVALVFTRDSEARK